MAKRGIDVGSLVAGVMFLGLAAVLVVRGGGSWDFDLLWLIPVLFTGLILVGVARALLRSRARSSEGTRAPDRSERAAPED